MHCLVTINNLRVDLKRVVAYEYHDYRHSKINGTPEGYLGIILTTGQTVTVDGEPSLVNKMDILILEYIEKRDKYKGRRPKLKPSVI